MNPVFGIHVGNSSVCLAMYKQDEHSDKFRVEVIANNAGDRVMPALVTITDEECIVGAACKSLMTSRWNTTVKCNKRMLNRENVKFLSNEERQVKTTFIDGELVYVLPLKNGDEHRSPTYIAMCIYQTLYEIAKTAVPGEDGDISCVLMVPQHFSDDDQFKIRTAAEAAGWDVLHIIHEPIAAVLGYNLLSEKIEMPHTSRNILVYRLGGRTCDATLLELNYGMISSVDTEHSEEIGGKVILSSVTKYLADEFYRRYKLDPNESHRALMKLIAAAENCIHVLSTIQSANCFVESVCEGVDFNHVMSRVRFESMLCPYLELFSKPIHTLLTRLNMSPDDIDVVLLCGGLIKIPRLKEHISNIFTVCTEIVPLPNSVNYDEILACGAAQQAGQIVLNKLSQDFLTIGMDIPVLEYPLTVDVEGAKFDTILFNPGQPIPFNHVLTLGPCENVVNIMFTQLESKDIMIKGQVELLNLREPTEVSLEIDSDIIKVGVCQQDEVRYHFIRLYAISL